MRFHELPTDPSERLQPLPEVCIGKFYWLVDEFVTCTSGITAARINAGESVDTADRRCRAWWNLFKMTAAAARRVS